MILKGYDKYQEVNFELQLGDDIDKCYDEINITNRAQSSKGTSGQIDCFWHSPDIEDYEPKRWSDLQFK